MKKENLLDTLLGNVTEEQIELFLEKHSGELATIIIEHIQTKSTALLNCNADPLSYLPEELKRKLIHRAAFRRAFIEGCLCIEDGKIVSRFRTPAALAYFLGRCFSNDISMKQCKFRMWIRGDREFPAAALNRLFGMTDLREIRKNHIKNKIPAWFKEIDNLFVVS